MFVSLEQAGHPGTPGRKDDTRNPAQIDRLLPCVFLAFNPVSNPTRRELPPCHAPAMGVIPDSAECNSLGRADRVTELATGFLRLLTIDNVAVMPINQYFSLTVCEGRLTT